LFGSLAKLAALGRGGAAVAESLGGVPVDPSSAHPDHRRLLNVVEEMSIASGLPMPAVYLMPEEEGINAFAAGLRTEHACVAVTQGALERLSRDELQGVMAHEFAHIRHGDMRLNVRLIGWLHGLLLLALIGRGMLRVLRHAPRRRSRNDKSGGILLAIAGAGLAVWLIGSIGMFFGRLIQAAVSRQREFLADAAAVELTRNPDGLIGALRKVGGLDVGGRVEHANAAEAAHLFFANGLSNPFASWFSTHPPLELRLARLGERVASRERSDAAGTAPEGASGFAGATPAASAPAQRAGQLLLDVPEAFREAVRSPQEARRLVCALLCASGGGRLPEVIASVLGTPEVPRVQAWMEALRAVPRTVRLPLLELALPALRRLGPTQSAALPALGWEIVQADGQLHLAEFCLASVLEHGLASPVAGDGAAGSLPLARVLDDAGVWISYLASRSDGDDEAGRSAQRAAWQVLGVVPAGVRLSENASAARLRSALHELRQLEPLGKRTLLAALRAAAGADGEVSEDETEVLRTVASALGIPLPPGVRV
jgi:Zn-dependent protease with chaperone function/uncharacterized tellurite resistance protein B-like protein